MLRQNLLIFAGILAMLFGLLFALQGANILPLPASSTMVGERDWVVRGVLIFVFGAILVGGARLVPTRGERRATRRSERDPAED